MSVLTDTAAYPITPGTARHLGRPLFGHVIDGQVVPSLDGATMPVIDPARGEQVATAKAGSAADVERAVRSARAAFDGGRWRNLPPLEQERLLRRLAALMAERADEFARPLVYHTPHQILSNDPESANVPVGRYHSELRRTGDGWKISRLVLDLLWGEAKTDAAGYLDPVGGRGPGGRRGPGA